MKLDIDDILCLSLPSFSLALKWLWSDIGLDRRGTLIGNLLLLIYLSVWCFQRNLISVGLELFDTMELNKNNNNE